MRPRKGQIVFGFGALLILYVADEVVIEMIWYLNKGDIIFWRPA